MVYWGCHTTRNRCVWLVCASFAAAAVVLLCVGSGRMWVCNHTPAEEDTLPGSLWSCRVSAGILMALSPVVLILGVLPSLLFFQSCFAVRPPQPVDWEKGTIPDSGITVVRRTTHGASVYRYDAQGRLLQAPDCYRHTSPSRGSPSPTKLSPRHFKWPQPGDVHIDVLHPAAVGAGVPYLTPGGANYVHGSSSKQGASSSSGSKGAQGGGSPQGRLYGSNAGTQEMATAEVFISLSPRRPHAGPQQHKEDAKSER